MKATHIFFGLTFLIGVIAFSGCVSTDMAVAQAGLNSSEEKQFRQAQTKTRVGGTAFGALAGAAIGYAIGGGWEGAVAGAVAGGTAGAVAGEAKAKAQGKILVTERQLDGLIAQTASANKSLRSQVSQLSAQRKAYAQRLASAKGNPKALASLKQEIKSSMNSADSAISSASKTIGYNGTVTGDSAAKQSLLRNETSKLSTSSKELQQERKLMASLYNSIDV